LLDIAVAPTAREAWLCQRKYAAKVLEYVYVGGGGGVPERCSGSLLVAPNHERAHGRRAACVGGDSRREGGAVGDGGG
jgi:hypothetical protein